jgi:hypothetical protein
MKALILHATQLYAAPTEGAAIAAADAINAGLTRLPSRELYAHVVDYPGTDAQHAADVTEHWRSALPRSLRES